MSNVQLTPAQHAILAYALEHTDGKISWFPENIKGGARQKVIDGLFKRALITSNGTDWFVAAEGYDALGRERPRLAEVTPTEPAAAPTAPEMAAPAPADAPTTTPTASRERRTREHSKQATVIALLRRAEGATIQQICAATGWQAHTVRGSFAGTFKKKLGLCVTSTKEQGAERVYRIADPAAV